MKYADGQDILLGDIVLLWNECNGVVVCSIDTDEYTTTYPKEEWEYLRSGVLILTDKAGLLHYIEADEDLTLIERKSTP